MTDSQRDMSKLTQRELLILLNERVSTLTDKVERISKDHYELKDQVNTINTRYKTLAAVWGFVTVLLTLLINAFKIFR